MNKRSPFASAEKPEGIKISDPGGSEPLEGTQNVHLGMKTTSMGLKNIRTKIGKNTVSLKKGNDDPLRNFLSSDDLGEGMGLDSDRGSLNQRQTPDKNKATPNEQVTQFSPRTIMPGQMVFHGPSYLGCIQNADYPETALDSNDYQKRLRFEELKRTKLEEMCQWKQKDKKGIKKNSYIKEIQKKNEKILSVAEKDNLEKLEVYTDRFPLLELRKSMNKLRIMITMLAYQIQASKTFDNVTISVILINSGVMIFQDPTDQNPPEFFEFVEHVFTFLYSMEMLIKITGRGFIMGDNAYLKESWNVLDFVIVISSYPSYFEGPNASSSDSGFSLSGLRVFRVMRPLKTISSVKGLKVLMNALFQAMPILLDTMAILFFFFAIFAIAGVNLLSGVLKQRCMNLQTGKIHPDDEPICGGNVNCPGGYFCGKTNQNPNFGVTNFDNVMYSFLCVFQSVTLEGWSDVQKQMQKAYTYNIWIYFLPLVFIGAFFLLNLTLAVINSEFTKAHKEHLNEELALNKKSNQISMDNELEQALNQKDELSIAQFITARIYAKKMKEFLRMRQQIKRIEQERLNKIKEKEAAFASAKRKIPLTKDLGINKNTTITKKFNANPLVPVASKVTEKKIISGHDIIPEDAAEHQEEHSDKEQLDKDIQEFLKNSRIHLQRQSHLGKTLEKSEIFAKREAAGGMPLMKGNIGPTSKHIIVNDTNYSSQNRQLFNKMAEEFDIDKVIPNARKTGNASFEDIGYSDGSFRLSINNDEIKSHNSSGFHKSMPDRMVKGLIDIPGYQHNLNDSESLITSDSQFEIAAGQGHGEGKDIISPGKKKKVNLKKDVSKTFKKMLQQNNQRDRESNSRGNEVSNQSTNFGGSFKNGLDGETVISEIEKKFSKKKMKKSLQHKFYKEDEIYNSFERKDKSNLSPILPGNNKENDIRNFQEFVNTKRPKDPFKDLDPLTQKVDITRGLTYQGTSQNDVFNMRFMKHNQDQPLHDNKFLCLPQHMRPLKDPDFIESTILRSQYEPYKQKVCYHVKIEHKEENQSDAEETNEDEIFAQEQPYMTAASIAYFELLKQLPTEELAKRSDIMITSTLSMSMFPKDKRIINNKKRANMTHSQIREYIDEKNAFNAIVKEHMYQTGIIKDKEKDFSDAYMKSFIHRSAFNTKTLRSFKDKVKILNSNKKRKPEKDKNIVKQEKMKHEQNKRAAQKRGLPKFDKEMAQKLLEGKFHDMDEDEDEEFVLKQEQNFDGMKSIYAKNREDMEQQYKLDNFEQQLRNIQKENDIEFKRIKLHDEIPGEIRKEFNLPDKMGMYLLNFNEVKKQDFSLKKQKPMWSGQDVLTNRLDEVKSLYIIQTLNRVRVWPNGIYGIYKRMRFQLRIIVKSAFFDSFMTFAVLCNTITLSIDHYGIEEEVTTVLNTFNTYFTWIFIVELLMKIVAVGVSKYCSDRMNYLDGSVVMLSVFEEVSKAILQNDGGEIGLDAFKTVRLLRTFRVFRIARLLRALKSMQVIIGVMVRSYKSFIYITLLMFLFIFIFSLLGMQTFGGQFSYPDGTPRGNYDSFPVAFITVFQVLTMENWQAVLFDSMRSDSISPFIVSIYYIVWIFLGNFILLNLFLAILLDSFIEEDEEGGDEDDDEFMIEQQKKVIMKRTKKKIKNDQLIMDLQNPILKHITSKDPNSNHVVPSKVYIGEMKDESEGEDLEDLDEEQIVKIYKDEGLIKKSNEELMAIQDFLEIDCQNSFYVFSQQNSFRIICYKLFKHRFWESSVQTLIVLSSMKLALDTYLTPTSPLNNTSFTIDIIFNVLFIIEMSVKLIAMGFVMDPGSYIRESWNRLDFFIVTSSIVDMAATGVDIPVIRILRMLRVLRPLRFINHNPNLKMVVIALLESMGSIFNVLIVIAVVYLIFAILGINFFGGMFFYCSIEKYQLQTEQQCLFFLGEWKRYDFNFDDVIEAMMSLYVVASLEYWPDIMFQALDVTKENLGPTKDASLKSSIFFVIFILVGSFFFLNFFIGVLFLKFKQAQKEEEAGYSKADLRWQDIQKLIISAEPEYESTNVPTEPWRKYFHELVSSKNFDLTITGAILLNMLQMALMHENQTTGFAWFLDFTNIIFTLIFLVEAIFKLIAFGKTYFLNSWNQFDFFVVCSSIIDLLFKALENIITGGGFIASAPQIARVMRVLRVTRALRLASRAQGLQSIIQTITFSITPLTNVVLLLILIFFMFSILGNFLFQQVNRGDVMDDIVNFQTFGSSFLLLFSISTGENWPLIMFDCSRKKEDGCIEGETCGTPPWSYYYFFAMVLICSYVMLNLFILVIIQQFEKYYLPKETTISRFKKDHNDFLKVWKKFTQDKFKCKKIKENQLIRFFRELGEMNADRDQSIGYSYEFYTEPELKKHMLKMGIKSDNGCVYFNELLYRCMRRKYGSHKIRRKMQIIELRTQYKIYKMTLEQKNQSTQRVTNDDIYNNIVKKENGVNPFLTIMNFRVSFKTWIKHARMKIREEARKKVKDGGKGAHDIDESTLIDQDNKKPYSVEIDIEEEYSVTSDEDSEPEPAVRSQGTLIMNQRKSHGSGSENGASQFGQSNLLMSERARDRASKKKKNHLQLFEKQMTQRFKVMSDANAIKAAMAKKLLGKTTIDPHAKMTMQQRLDMNQSAKK